MTNIIFKDKTGTVKSSIVTKHGGDPRYIRDMTASHLSASGAFQNFGREGDTLSVEREPHIGAGIAPGKGELASCREPPRPPHRPRPSSAMRTIGILVSRRYPSPPLQSQ